MQTSWKQKRLLLSVWLKKNIGKHRSTLAFESRIKKQVPAGEIHNTRATTDNITFWLANENQRRHSRNFMLCRKIISLLIAFAYTNRLHACCFCSEASPKRYEADYSKLLLTMWMGRKSIVNSKKLASVSYTPPPVNLTLTVGKTISESPLSTCPASRSDLPSSTVAATIFSFLLSLTVWRYCYFFCLFWWKERFTKKQQQQDTTENWEGGKTRKTICIPDCNARTWLLLILPGDELLTTEKKGRQLVNTSALHSSQTKTKQNKKSCSSGELFCDCVVRIVTEHRIFSTL